MIEGRHKDENNRWIDDYGELVEEEMPDDAWLVNEGLKEKESNERNQLP